MSVVGEWPVRVYYEDTDHGGGVYYANYLKYFERGRTELLRALGFEQDDLMGREGLLFVVRKVEADYLRPAVFNDRLRVVTEVADLGRARVDFEQSVLREGETKPLCRGRVQVACVGAGDFRPSPIPEAVRRALGFGEA
ncbi:tol-pal system-associated acyl-CoA thioesterase [Thiohalorhabdus methylotrophus]|uniref:Tol-pal system-associated acyl-CoA thioesterase n=1 Tax=Thiohalorhabdus methylotrophus TaxID=3242694 RepID=A0ABV4TRD7_9GAMM